MAITTSLSTFILWCFTFFVLLTFMGMWMLIVHGEDGIESAVTLYILSGICLAAIVVAVAMILVHGFLVIGVVALIVILLVIGGFGYAFGSWLPERLK